MTEKILLTPIELADITGISRNTIQQWCRDGYPFATRLGRNFKINRHLFQKWLDEKCKTGEPLN